MRNTAQMRWIEQAAAREVFMGSRLLLPPATPWCGKARDAAMRWRLRLGAWWSERQQIDWLTARPQPVLVHPTPRRRGGGDGGYRSCWGG